MAWKVELPYQAAGAAPNYRNWRKCPTHWARKSSFQPCHRVKGISFQADRGGLAQAVPLTPKENADNEPPREKGASVAVSQRGKAWSVSWAEEHTWNTTSLITRYRSLGLEIGEVFTRGLCARTDRNSWFWNKHRITENWSVDRERRWFA